MQCPNASETSPIAVQFVIEVLRLQCTPSVASSYSARAQAALHCLALSTYDAVNISVPDSTIEPMYATSPQSDWSCFLQLADFDSNLKLGL
jgi:hypothetical protein